MSDMRIVLLSPTFGGTSGVGRHVQVLFGKLAERGHRLRVISTNNTPFINARNLRNPSWALFAGLKKAEAEIIHAHNLPSIVPAKVYAGKKVLTLHGAYSSQVGLLHGGLLGSLARRFEPWVLKWADAITCVSKKMSRAYEGLGVKVEYVPNAVDCDRIEQIVRRVGKRPNRVVYMGRKSKEKGYDIFVKASANLSRRYEFLSVEGREWEEAISLLASSTVLVVPSRLEGLPTVILEAFAAGTMVIGSGIDGIMEVVEEGKTGLLFTPGDHRALAQRLEEALTDEGLRSALTVKAKDKVRSEYDWELALQRYLSVYARLTGM